MITMPEKLYTPKELHISFSIAQKDHLSEIEKFLFRLFIIVR